jgi:hypothetical protein
MTDDSEYLVDTLSLNIQMGLWTNLETQWNYSNPFTQGIAYHAVCSVTNENHETSLEEGVYLFGGINKY